MVSGYVKKQCIVCVLQRTIGIISAVYRILVAVDADTLSDAKDEITNVGARGDGSTNMWPLS